MDQEGRNQNKEDFLAANEASYEAIFSPTPGFKGQLFTALGFITGNINFCVDVPEIQV